MVFRYHFLTALGDADPRFEGSSSEIDVVRGRFREGWQNGEEPGIGVKHENVRETGDV